MPELSILEPLVCLLAICSDKQKRLKNFSPTFFVLSQYPFPTGRFCFGKNNAETKELAFVGGG